MVIDRRLDVVVWVCVAVVFVLLGARAWAVETGAVRLHRTPARVKLLTGASAVAITVLVGLLAMQGGILLVQSVITRTDPEDVVTIVPAEPGEETEPEDESVAPLNPPAVPVPDPAAPPPGG